MATAIAEQESMALTEPSATPRISPLTWAAADVTGNTIVIDTGRCLVLFRNSGATPRTVAVASSPDPFNRKADIAATSLAAGAIFGKIFERTAGSRRWAGVIWRSPATTPKWSLRLSRYKERC